MKQPKYFSQYEPPYNTFPYPSANHPQATIQTSGCGVTCFAMVHFTLLNSNYSPIDGAKDAMTANDRGLEGTEDEYYLHMANKYKLLYSDTKDLKTALNALQDGKLIVCHMINWFKPGSGHFVLAWGMKDGEIQINDPASRANTLKTFSQSLFKEKCVGYFIFDKQPTSINQQLDTITYLSTVKPKILTDVAYWTKQAMLNKSLLELFKNMENYIKGDKI